MDELAVVSSLRSARQAKDTISRLREGSLETRSARIAEALADPEWGAGPAQLICTYPHHALAEKNGILMRVKISEGDDGIKLGKVEVHEIPESVADVGAEVMETAMAAVDHILDDDIEGATPLVASIANALNFSGDLRRQVTTEVAKRSISRDAWWHQVVREATGDKGTITSWAQPREGDLAGSIDDLREGLIGVAKTTAASVQALAEIEVAAEIEEVAKDIVADMKYAIQALGAVDREDEAEMAGVYEGVQKMTTDLLRGARFLESMVGPANTESEE